jgi:hypothetical protein
LKAICRGGELKWVFSVVLTGAKTLVSRMKGKKGKLLTFYNLHLILVFFVCIQPKKEAILMCLLCAGEALDTSALNFGPILRGHIGIIIISTVIISAALAFEGTRGGWVMRIRCNRSGKLHSLLVKLCKILLITTMTCNAI